VKAVHSIPCRSTSPPLALVLSSPVPPCYVNSSLSRHESRSTDHIGRRYSFPTLLLMQTMPTVPRLPVYLNPSTHVLASFLEVDKLDIVRPYKSFQIDRDHWTQQYRVAPKPKIDWHHRHEYGTRLAKDMLNRVGFEPTPFRTSVC
jgi:hypothetical protein